MPDEASVAVVRKKLALATNAVHTVLKDSTANMGDRIGNVSYASIGAVLTAVKAALQEQNLALSQPFGYVPTDALPIMTVDTIITDTTTGDYLAFQGPGFPVKGDPQAAAGAITYFRRYALVTLFGLIVDDDDGNEATRIHRNPLARTDAEIETRAIIAEMDDEDRPQFFQDFQEQFGSNLSDLSTHRHGAALSFTRFWSANDDPPAEAAPADAVPEGAT